MEVKVNSTTIRSFSIYSNTLPNDFLLDVTKAWRLLNETFRAELTEITYFQHISRWLRFLADRPNHEIWSYIEKGSDSGSLQEEYLAWQNLITEYRNDIFDSFPTADQLTTRNNKLIGVRKLLEYLAYTKTIPHGLVLRGWKDKPRLGQSSTFLSNDFYRLINRSKNDLQKLVFSFDDNDVSLDEDVISLIKNALENTEEDFDFNPVSLVISSLQGRKNQLKNQAANDYIAYIESTNQAEKWAKDLEISACADKLHKVMLSNVDAHTKMNLYDEALGGCATSVLVNYLIRYNEGRLLLNKDSRYGLFWHPDRMSRYNYNRDHIRRYLGCSNYEMVCAFAFIMLETNANTTSIWGLEEGDLIELNDNFFQLNWTKQRQRGHESKYRIFPIRKESLTTQNLTVRDVFIHQLECRKKFLNAVIQKDQKYLFLQWYKNNVKISESERVYAPTRPSLASFNRYFKMLCEKASNGAWVTTPKAIRGSALLLTGLVTRDATAVMIEGQHTSLEMGKRYTYHYPEVWLQDKEIRLFLNWYQALFTVDIEGFAEKIGIDSILYNENKEFALEQRQKEAQNAINQQFGGIHCIDPTAGAQPGTKAGRVCNKVDKCPTCKQRRGVFVTSINNLANVIQWHEILVQLKQTLSDNEFYKWRVWHVFTTLIVDTFSKDPTHARLMREAQEKAALTQNSYASLIPVAEVNI
ncbi:hypothetical protein [Marinomonas polaris]|uniref:hypothetical protein n=1 Tax=Marinomonas polaris TaxID=293552 RepID=UPI003F975BA4